MEAAVDYSGPVTSSGWAFVYVKAGSRGLLTNYFPGRATWSLVVYGIKP